MKKVLRLQSISKLNSPFFPTLILTLCYIWACECGKLQKTALWYLRLLLHGAETHKWWKLIIISLILLLDYRHISSSDLFWYRDCTWCCFAFVCRPCFSASGSLRRAPMPLLSSFPQSVEKPKDIFRDTFSIQTEESGPPGMTAAHCAYCGDVASCRIFQRLQSLANWPLPLIVATIFLRRPRCSPVHAAAGYWWKDANAFRHYDLCLNMIWGWRNPTDTTGRPGGDSLCVVTWVSVSDSRRYKGIYYTKGV